MKKLVWLLFLLGTLTSFGQHKKLDSLYVLLNNHLQEDQQRVDLLNEISRQNIGVNYFQARANAERALLLAEKLSYVPGIADSKNRLAVSLWSLGENDLAIECALGATELIKKNNLGSVRLAENYRALGFAYLDLKEFDRAGIYLQKGKQICLQNKNWELLTKMYLGLLRLNYLKKQFDSAAYFEKEYNLLLKDHSDAFNEPLLRYFKVIEISDPKLAIKEFLNLLTLTRASGNRYVETMSLIMLGVNFSKEKNLVMAERYLLQALRLSREIGIKSLTSQSYQVLEDLKKQQGKFEEAMAFQKAIYELRDSITNGRKTRQVIELETQYEKEKQEQEVKLLMEQRRADVILKYSLLIGLAVVILFSVVIYKLQQSKARKVNELLVSLKSTNDKLKETDTLKSRFFANISHEFRTPLTLILAPIEDKLASAQLAAVDKESFQLIRRNTYRLIALVNQLLDLSKLEAKKMELVVEQGNLKKLLTIVGASFDSLAENKKIHFEKNFRLGEIESWYDADKLEKIVNNLLFNALKFTPAGGTVTFSASQLNQTKDLELNITDTGIGIPEEEQGNVFSPFYQSKYTTDDGSTGTGLGLALVKELVRLYGGTIELVSAVHQGTSITVTLPIVKERLPALAIVNSEPIDIQPVSEVTKNYFDEIAEVESEEVEPHRDSVLIVEDNEDLRNFISSTLQGQFTTLTAKDGEEGYAIAIQHIPDLIISDVMMPNLDGIGFAKKIRTDERTSHVPVVLLTARADQESKMEGLQAGVDDYLAKPFSTDELRVRVTNLIEQRKKLAMKYKANLSTLLKPHVENSMDEKFLLRAKQIVADNLSNSHFGVEQMAREINLSRTQLFRKLKAIAGFSPNEFINEIRLHKAAELILSKADTLTQISYSVGFNEQSYFAKRFRKKFGVAPGEYYEKTMKQVI